MRPLLTRACATSGGTMKAAAMVSVSRTAKRPNVARGMVRVAESPAPNLKHVMMD